jgi:5,10-methylene-tetrahydrofolate dehydrogenase/methenyl tetrahydrofolate cyclohydrolase
MYPVHPHDLRGRPVADERERIVGDVDVENACNVASWTTPVPGGSAL